MSIKIGMGLRTNEPQLISEANGLFKSGLVDFVEIFVIPEADSIHFQKLEMPLTIHAPHDSSGVNLCDPSKLELSKGLINKAVQIGERLNAKFVTCHSGHINKNYDYKNAMDGMIDSLTLLNHKSLCIENLTFNAVIDGMICTCHKPEDVQEIVKKTKLGFCLDLNHAYKAAVSLGQEPKGFIGRFMELKPSYFHLTDGNMHQNQDEHLPLGQGDYDLKFMKECVNRSKSKMAVIETRRKSHTSLEENVRDIEFLRGLE